MRVVKILLLLVLSFGALAYAQKEAEPQMDKDTKIKILQNENNQMKLIWQQQRLQDQLNQLHDQMNQLQEQALTDAKLDPKEWAVNPDTQSFEHKPDAQHPKPEAKKAEPPK